MVTAGANGTATASVTPATALPEGAYLVVVTADANGYVLPEVATASFVVSATGNTYISGGGYVASDSTASSGPSPRGYFSFDSSKAMSTVGGSVAYVYRMRVNVDGTNAGGSCPHRPAPGSPAVATWT